jgi:hypothetical protein
MSKYNWGIKYNAPDTHLSLDRDEVVFVGPYPGGHFSVTVTGAILAWQVSPGDHTRTHVEPFVITPQAPFQFYNIDREFEFEIQARAKGTDVMVVRISELGVSRDEVK